MYISLPVAGHSICSSTHYTLDRLSRPNIPSTLHSFLSSVLLSRERLLISALSISSSHFTILSTHTATSLLPLRNSRRRNHAVPYVPWRRQNQVRFLWRSRLWRLQVRHPGMQCLRGHRGNRVLTSSAGIRRRLLYSVGRLKLDSGRAGRKDQGSLGMSVYAASASVHSRILRIQMLHLRMQLVSECTSFLRCSRQQCQPQRPSASLLFPTSSPRTSLCLAKVCLHPVADVFQPSFRNHPSFWSTHPHPSNTNPYHVGCVAALGCFCDQCDAMQCRPHEQRHVIASRASPKHYRLATLEYPRRLIGQ